MSNPKSEVIDLKRRLLHAYLLLPESVDISEQEWELAHALSRDADIQAILEKARQEGR